MTENEQVGVTAGTKVEKDDEKIFRSISVDMSSYCKPLDDDSSDKAVIDTKRMECARAILAQLEQDGFALVRGTGINQNVCANALHWTHSFLQEAPESVRRSTLTKDRARR